MEKVYLRVISFTFDIDCLQRIKDAFLNVLYNLQIANINFSELKPYCKIDGCGEMDIDFQATQEEIDEIKSLLSDKWEINVTDSRWAKIFCDDITFIGLST